MNNHTDSYWKQTGKLTNYPSIHQNITTEVVIIGGGITGVSCAYSLVQAGLRPVLLEAESLCGGTTGNTTGKITVQHHIIYSKLLSIYGIGRARSYYQSQRKALDFVKDVITRENISCQRLDDTAYIYASDAHELNAITKEHAVAMRLGIDAELINKPEVPFSCCGMLGYKKQMVLHPLRYIEGLADAARKNGAAIYCGTKVIKLEEGDRTQVFCETGVVITAKHVIMATGYPFYDGPNLFFARLFPKRSYGIAVKAINDWPTGSFISAGEPTRSFRTHIENGEPILIVAGDGHVTGRGSEEMSDHFDHLLQFADRLAGVRETLSLWSAQDYETPDLLPYIGRISARSNVYLAAGFRKWGLTNGTLAGLMLTDIICSGDNRYEKLYSRSRPDMLTAPGPAIGGVASSLAALVKSKIEQAEEIEKLAVGEGRVIRFDGAKAGIYRNETGDVILLDITCTHMGTVLNFNSAEKTWDCPAHGGRYNTAGELLEGPPKNPLRVLFCGKYEDLTK